VIGNGDVHGIHPASAHLFKDPGREVGVLQVVDQRRFHTRSMGGSLTRLNNKMMIGKPISAALHVDAAHL
jgi:hypothetical protein